MIANINWADVITRLIGDGIIITGIGYLIHRQNMQFEKRKRADYFVQRNYDELMEIGIKLHQLLISWWQFARKAEKGNKPITDLWREKFPVRYKDKTESINFGAFIKQNHLFIPSEISDLFSKADKEYNNGQYGKAKKLLIDADIKLSEVLGIKRSRDEIRRLFEHLSV